MSVSYAKWLENLVPKSNGIASIELVVRSNASRHVLKNAHVFGCRVYVLDPKMQKIWDTYLNINHDLNVVCLWALVSAIHHWFLWF